jgi:hypothetical protein
MTTRVYLLACVAFPRITGPAVVAVFDTAVAGHGFGP